MIEYLTILRDNMLNVNYKLYKVNAKYIKERLLKSYKINNVMLQVFNSDTRLLDNICSFLRYLRREPTSIIKIINEPNKKFQEKIKEISMGSTFGYEVMPISISVDGNFENINTKIELIDGFRRIFYIDEVPDIDILVKVYPKLSDKEWINTMIVYNSWKFADAEPCTKYIDRGFQLGLYGRYNIQFLILSHKIKYKNIFSLIDIYIQTAENRGLFLKLHESSMVYKTLWDNDKFIDDLLKITETCSYIPTFKYRTKGEIVEYTHKPEHFGDGLFRIYEIFIRALGDIRRLEYKTNIKDRKSFNIKVFYDFMNEEKLQKRFIKILQMTVDGHIVNHINTHLVNDIYDRVYTSMGYTYKKPKEIKEDTNKPHIPISEMLF